MSALVDNLPVALRSHDALFALLKRIRRVLTPSTVCNALIIALTAALVQRYIRARRALRATGWVPGLRLAIDPIFPYPLPAIPWVSMEPDWWVHLGYGVFQRAGTDVLSVATLFPPRVSLLVADAVAVKEIHSSRARFPKPVEMFETFNVYGVSIASAEGADYRRHRTPAQGSFTERNNRSVWMKARGIAREFLESDAWREDAEGLVKFEDAVKSTAPFTLQVVCAAGFGLPVTVKERDLIPPGHTMPILEAIDVVTTHLVTRVLVPKFARRMTSHLRRVDNAYSDVWLTMGELIAARRVDPDAAERTDLFTSLVQATDDEKDDSERLEDHELFATAITFMVAGHESTAHTLAFVMIMLAMYPEEQDLVLAEVKQYAREDGMPVYEDLNKLRQCLAFMYESQRFYPPAPRLYKRSAFDTTLPLSVPMPSGVMSIPVAAGTVCVTDIAALHTNPRWWPEPHTFRSSRFLDPNWPRDAFMSWSQGGRMCIGRRFAETEAMVLICAVVGRYRVELPETTRVELARAGLGGLDGHGKGLSGEEQKMRREMVVKRTHQGLTLKPLDVPLVFRRRV